MTITINAYGLPVVAAHCQRLGTPFVAEPLPFDNWRVIIKDEKAHLFPVEIEEQFLSNPEEED